MLGHILISASLLATLNMVTSDPYRPQVFPKGRHWRVCSIPQRPQTVKGFEDQGCNYWKQWADKQCSRVDYGNLWIDFAALTSKCLANSIKGGSNGRRHVVTGWLLTTYLYSLYLVAIILLNSTLETTLIWTCFGISGLVTLWWVYQLTHYWLLYGQTLFELTRQAINWAVLP